MKKSLRPYKEFAEARSVVTAPVLNEQRPPLAAAAVCEPTLSPDDAATPLTRDPIGNASVGMLGYM